MSEHLSTTTLRQQNERDQRLRDTSINYHSSLCNTQQLLLLILSQVTTKINSKRKDYKIKFELCEKCKNLKRKASSKTHSN